MATVYVAVGSNLGDRKRLIEEAFDRIGRIPEITLSCVSSIIETEPEGGPAGQNRYLNAAARIETNLDPFDLLTVLQKIEFDLGRVRSVPNGPRTIDLDILLYDDAEMRSAELTIPHPRMFDRLFVLIPLLEIAPTIADELSVVRAHRPQIARTMRKKGLT
jgi:2-amino-4-hydroxy-6-hydroxymethyldihydropteridine diphosphokinase